MSSVAMEWVLWLREAVLLTRFYRLANLHTHRSSSQWIYHRIKRILRAEYHILFVNLFYLFTPLHLNEEMINCISFELGIFKHDVRISDIITLND